MADAGRPPPPPPAPPSSSSSSSSSLSSGHLSGVTGVSGVTASSVLCDKQQIFRNEGTNVSYQGRKESPGQNQQRSMPSAPRSTQPSSAKPMTARSSITVTGASHSNHNEDRWQCAHSLFFEGMKTTTPQPPGLLGTHISDIGPLTAVKEPLALTYPYVSNLQEVALKHRLLGTAVSDNHCVTQHTALMLLQRQLRSNFIKKNCGNACREVYSKDKEVALSATALLSSLLPLNTYFRRKRQNKREAKTLEKNMREKQGLRDSMRRRNFQSYSKAALNHRDEFLRYHKAKRSDCARMGRAVRQQLESVETRKGKQEEKEEARRLQALKENDMESYMQLVQETKNSRLRHLLDQTDDYISTINRMVQAQRKEAELSHRDGDVVDEQENDNDDGETGCSQTTSGLELSKSYYANTHEKTEVVVQPRMLQGGDLKEYQLAGLQWLVSLYNNNLNGILADDMGLGKTIQTLALLSYIMEYKQNNGPFLVVVPLSTLSNWVNEAEKWTPTMIKVVYRGKPLVRKQIYKEEVEPGHFNTLFTSYEYIMKDKAVLKRIVWQYIVVDEGHRMKNANSKFAQTLGNSYKSRNRLLLTGTPLQNNLPELWALLNFLLPSIFNSVETFDQWFNQPFASFRQQQAVTDDGGNDAAQLSQEERLLIVHRLHEVLRPFMLRRVKDQVLDQLPEKTETVLRCNLSQWQRTLYRLIHRKTLATVTDAVGNVNNIYGSGLNNVLMQLRKICNHPYLFLNEYAIDEDLIRSSGKFELLDRMLPKLKRAGHRVLMFSQMTQVMTILERYFDYRRYSFLRLDGSTPAEERERRMYTFNDPDSPYFIFLLSTRAGGLGLNLATADVVILFDSDWNPMMDAQAQDRAHRIGQRNEVRVFRLVTTSIIESKVLARATDKRNLNDLVVEAGKFNDGNANGGPPLSESDEHDKKKMMESLLKEYAEGADVDEEDDDEEGLVPDNEQVNELMSFSESEFALYQDIDKERLEHIRKMWVNRCHNEGKPFDKKSQPPALMTNDTVPVWIRHAEAWQSKHVQLHLMYEEYDKQRVRGHDVDLRKLDSAGDSDAGSGGVIWDSYASVPGQEIGERKRKVVQYDDGLTETQFINMVENEEKKQAMAKSSQKQANKVKRKATPQSSSSSTSALESSLSKGIVKILNGLCKKQDDTGEFLLYGLFIDKPDKKMFPDYYQIISHPVAIKGIITSLKKGKYSTLDEVKGDMEMLCENAAKYNQQGSVVHNASLTLKDDFFAQLDVLQEKLTNSRVTNSCNGRRDEPLKKKKKVTPSKENIISCLHPLVDDGVVSEATKPSSSSLKMTLPSALFKSQYERNMKSNQSSYSDTNSTNADGLTNQKRTIKINMTAR